MVGRAGGGKGVTEEWHVEAGLELGGKRSNERCRRRGAAEGGGSKARPGQAGGMAVGPPCVLSPLVLPGLSLRTASAACFTCKTHPVERASTHGAKGKGRKAFLRQCWEKREVGILSSLPLPVFPP
ncbi:hypothetical protein AMECASPLE_021041 [Ameca splendens]|uniref:Uncharacterized protein n=1 Tax=Ameca splendens TaxID=208324 RepID=A0ABV0XSF3_9TELE